MSSTPTLSGTRPVASAFRGGFFLWMAALLLALVLFAFAPTLYLRALFAVPPIPGYLYAHGAIMTAWFVWLSMQTWLVATGQTALHRRMGAIGIGIAIAVVIVGPMATLNVVARARSTGVDWEADMSALGIAGIGGVTLIRFIASVVWGNIMSIVTFSALVCAAVLVRRNTEAHKRLMLLASISVLGPALARIARLPGFGGEGGPLLPVVLLALLLTVIVYDLVRRRRPHSATIAGVATIVASAAIAQLIASQPFGQALVRAME